MSGEKYGKSFRGTKDMDLIGVFVDLKEGRLFFSKNGEVFRTAFQGGFLLKSGVYGACSCLTKDECFKSINPQPED